MKKIVYTLCFIYSAIGMSAQNATITGRVTDDKGEGLIQAAVVIDASKGLATVTDFDGNYELSIAAGTYEVTYRYTGKEENRVKLTLAPGEKKLQNITLKEKTKMMDEVVVSGSKYARKLSEESVSMDVLKGSTLSDQNITSLDNGVQKIPGVTIADGQANIRGGAGWSYGAGSRVAILYDGLPVTTADADDAKWSMIPMEQVEQVEVIKGAASALYGSGALNGIINAITAWPTDKPYTKVSTYFGFYGNPPDGSMRWWLPGQLQHFEGFSVADRRKVGQVDIMTAAGYTGDKGYLDSSDAYDLHLNVKVRWRSKKIEGLSVGMNVVAYYSWGKTFFIWDSTGSKGYEPLPGTITIYHDGRYIVDPFINYFDKKDNKFSFKYRYLNSTNLNTTGQGSIGHRNYAELQYAKMMKNIDLNIIAGAVGMYDIAHAPPGDTASLIGNHNRGNFAVYAQVDKRFFKRLNTTLGVRWEYFNVDDTIQGSHHGRKTSISSLPYPLGRIGLNYQAAEGTFLRLSGGMGFRFPSLAEMYVSTRVGPLGVFSNPSLTPEKGYSAEVGARQLVKLSNTWGLYGDVALFANYYNNMMEFTFGQFGKPTDPLFGLGFSSQNIGNTRILGSDIGMGLQGKMGDFDVSFVAGYTYIDARALNWNDSLKLYNSEGQRLAPTSINATYAATSSDKNNFLKYRSRNQLKLILTLAYKFIELNADYQYLGFQENIDAAFVSKLFADQSSAFGGLQSYRANQIANGSKGYNILNIGIGFKATSKFKVSAIVKNVSNTEWMARPGLFQAPRNYTLQLAYTF
jgi:iron complex outermembrane receptor protein